MTLPLFLLNSNVNTGTDTITSLAHGLSSNQPVSVSLYGPGTLPAPLVSDVTYFVLVTDADHFQLSLTSGGSAIDLTTQGTGGFEMFASSVPVAPGGTEPGLSVGNPPNFTIEANGAGEYPRDRFNQRERKLLQSVQAQLNSASVLMAQAVWDFSVNGGSIGTHILTTSLPTNSLITSVVAQVVTAPTSAGSTGTIKLSVPTDGDLTTTQTANGSAVTTVFTDTPPVLTTASRTLQVVIATTAITAGRIRYFVNYRLTSN